MKRRLRWRWLRAFAWRLVRTQYLLGLTVAVIAVAAAAGLGLFDADESPRPERRQQAVAAPTRTPVPFNTPIAFIPPEPLTVTYYLVDNEHDQRVYETFEDGIIFREILEKDAIEILLIRNAEEQDEATRILEQAAVLAQESGFILLVKDLRD
jgi:hypothetical protein